MKPLHLIALIFLLLIIGLKANPAQAHPADMFFQSHAIQLTSDGIDIIWSITPGSLIVPLVWSDADQDYDGSVTAAEAKTWVEQYLVEYTGSVNNTSLPLELEAVEWPTSLENFQIGNETIAIHLKADWPAELPNDSLFSLRNQFEEAITINWFSIQAEGDVGFHSPQQTQGALQFNGVLPDDTQSPTTMKVWDSGTPSLEAAAAKTLGLTSITEEATDTTLPEDPRPAARLASLMRSQNLSITFFLVAFAIAGVLGSLHALTPGHGKTVVAAYLVGAKGTTLHAISLGAIVTLTHTGSVFALGLVALAASQYILPTSLFPILEIISGLLIVGLGGYLLYYRWAAHRAGQHHHHDHSHHHHGHDHDHHHHHDIPDKITWRSLITLGVSGGLVPCPDAIAILLIAITINRILLGLSLIVAFSLGLALVLIVIGLVLVHSRRLFDRMDAFNRIAPVMPLVSAVIVLLLGVVLTYNAILGPEVLAFAHDEIVAIETIPENELSQAEAQAKQDSIDEAKILYIAQDDQRHPQLFVHPLNNNEPKFITQAPSGIRTYYLSPDGDKIVYTTQRDDGGSELWFISSEGSDQRQLLVCPEVACDGVAWSPDAQRIVYEKREIASPENPLGLPSLWWFAIDSGETQLVFPNSQWSGFNPSWSPDGQWISYTSAGSGQIELYNLVDGRRHTLDNQVGGNVAWHPNAKSILFQDVQTKPEGFFIHLLNFDLDSGATINLSEAANAEDSNSVAWSPDGEQVAVVRRISTASNSARGNQIWVMRPDGSEAQQLTNQPNIFYSTVAWSRDGQHLLFQQTLLGGDGKSEIWMISVETNQLQRLGLGRWPNWLP